MEASILFLCHFEHVFHYSKGTISDPNLVQTAKVGTPVLRQHLRDFRDLVTLLKDDQ